LRVAQSGTAVHVSGRIAIAVAIVFDADREPVRRDVTRWVSATPSPDATMFVFGRKAARREPEGSAAADDRFIFVGCAAAADALHSGAARREAASGVNGASGSSRPAGTTHSALLTYVPARD